MMDLMTPKCMTLLFVFIFLQRYDITEGRKIKCGFPGSPAYGYLKPDEKIYSEGDIVSYSCRVGYILLGSPISRCKEDGSWSENIPICDDSMTTLGVAFSTPAVPGHPAELAIDRDKETCTNLLPKKPRWWRIDLGGVHKVLSVAVTMLSPDKYVKFTVFVIRIEGTNASYKRCASFSGKFGTQTIVLSCAEGKGIQGQRVHLEDHQQTEGLFEICEVEVQVEKDAGYDCGRPDRKPYSRSFEPEGGEVEYGCMTGYELRGNPVRTCLSTGQWSGRAPTCKAIVCERLHPLENGELRITETTGDVALEGAVATFNCDEGFKLLGDFTRICLKDGSWSGRPPQCKAIRCPAPDGKELGGIYRLVNKTSRMGSMALLKCRRGKSEGNNPYITCTEEGAWTEPQAHCLLPSGASLAIKEEPQIVNKGGVIFGMVVAAVMITVVMVSCYVVMKRRRLLRKPELPSRLIEPIAAPPRPPPRSRGFGPSIRDFMNRDASSAAEKLPVWKADSKVRGSAWKTQSLPLNHADDHNGITEGEPSATRALSYDDTLHGENEGQKQSGARNVVDQEKEKLLIVPSEGETKSKGDGSEEGGSGVYAVVTEDDNESSPENAQEKEEDKDLTETPEQRSSGEYAAVDYDKKRQSRLLKDQDSTASISEDEGDKDRQLPSRDIEESLPTVPSKVKESSSEEEEESSEESAKFVASIPKSIVPSESLPSAIPTSNAEVVESPSIVEAPKAESPELKSTKPEDKEPARGRRRRRPLADG